MCGPQKITELIVFRTDAGILSSLQFWLEGSWFLLLDNTPSYCAIIVNPFLTNYFVAISQPPCSPDLVPADLFPFSETTLKTKSSYNVEELKRNVTAQLSAVFGQLRWQFFSPFRKMEKVWCNQGRLHFRES